MICFFAVFGLVESGLFRVLINSQSGGGFYDRDDDQRSDGGPDYGEANTLDLNDELGGHVVHAGAAEGSGAEYGDEQGTHNTADAVNREHVEGVIDTPFVFDQAAAEVADRPGEEADDDRTQRSDVTRPDRAFRLFSTR